MTPTVLAEMLVAQNVAFYVIAVMMVVAAFRVVTTRNVVHAALWLIVVLGGAAAQYILLAAEFIAITQVMVYIGAVVVLFLFGIMLTRAPMGDTEDLDNPRPSKLLALGVGVIMLGVIGYTLVDAFKDRKFANILVQRTGEVGDSLFSTFLVPFEVVSVLLLAALIGAIVLARRD